MKKPQVGSEAETGVGGRAAERGGRRGSPRKGHALSSAKKLVTVSGRRPSSRATIDWEGGGRGYPLDEL